RRENRARSAPPRARSAACRETRVPGRGRRRAALTGPVSRLVSGRRRLGLGRFGRRCLRRPLLPATAAFAPALAPPAAALLLQLRPAPLRVQVVLLDVVLRLRPDGDAL